MYGSDKVLLSLVLGMGSRGIHPVVFLPSEGPLLSALDAGGIETHIVPVTKLDRKTLSPMGLLKLPIKLLASMWAVSRVLKGRHIDLVYSNTLAVLGAAVWAKFRRIPHVWHVHELLVAPRVVRQGFPLLLRFLADRVLCNSTLTEKWVLDEQPSLSTRTVVIWNGIEPRPPVREDAVTELRSNLGVHEGQLLVALVGRINRYKGQELLINAAEILWNKGFRDVHYLIVGGAVPGQEHLVSKLKQQISDSVVGAQIHIMQFTSDVWSVWDACDIGVVPSITPESFGMVAIEAMAAKKPVVVAAHGGVLDIVEHDVSGLLFEPGDAALFASEIEKLISAPNIRHQLGEAGCERQKKLFSLAEQQNRTAELLLEMSGVK